MKQKTNSGDVAIIIRIQYEYDTAQYDCEDAKELAIDRVVSALSGAGLYNTEEGLTVTDIDNCGESY